MADDEGLWHLLGPVRETDPVVGRGFPKIEIVPWRVVESILE